jgi:peptidoglycan/LPS O-acetylase OafA/YrhL
VDLFFALSGYLIVGFLLAERRRTGAIDVKAFAIRRLFKIYPPYLLFLAAVVAWSYGQGVGSPRERLLTVVAGFWPTLAHLQNYIGVAAAPHLWSLAVEEHGYALMLGIVLLSGRRGDPLRSRWVPFALLGLFVASWTSRCAHVAWRYAGEGPIGFTFTHNRLDALLAGSVVAWVVQRGRDTSTGAAARRRRKLALLAAGAVCLVPTLALDAYAHRSLVLLGVLPLQAVGFALILLALAVPLGRRQAGPQSEGSVEGPVPWPIRLLAFVGISSYSTYLWHVPFAQGLARHFALGSLDAHPAAGLLRLGIFVALSLAVGAVSYVAVERPALAWRRRWLGGADRPVGRPIVEVGSVAR